MWITGDVELPDQILDAHEHNELVFFIGAGVSVDKPSELPLFKGLAKELARRASHKFSEGIELDYFIGQLEALPQGFDVHRHAHQLFANSASRFNPLHSAIVDLAGIGKVFRVVTTNYDNHLASAATDRSIVLPDTWYAPALPIGNDFSGLVHLHGSVKRPKEEMILTDRDFGRAYITDAWATRFLLPMFERFTVVFIGYSHDDVIMRYLALGLPSNGKGSASKRFAFTSNPEDNKWSYLGIQPIAYPVVGNDHQALVAAITAWAELSKMGYTDHRSRLRRIVRGGTSLPMPDHDYLRARLRTEEGAKEFALAAGSLSDEIKLKWLRWLEDLSEFKDLFSPSYVPDSMDVLADWFSEKFVQSKTLNGAALQTVQQLGQSMSESLYRKAALSVNELCEQDIDAGRRWQTFLATSILGHSAPLEANIIAPLLLGSEISSVAVLRAVLRPFLKLKKRWYAYNSEDCAVYPDAEVTWNARHYELEQYIKRVMQSSSPGNRSLGDALEGAIISAYDLLDAYYGDWDRDRLVCNRSDIGSHAQIIQKEPLDAIIDGIRDYGISSLPLYPDLPDRWWGFKRVLMQRLALYLVGKDVARSVDEKISWLLDRNCLYVNSLKRETYQLLADAVPSASPEIKNRVLVAAVEGPDYSDEVYNCERILAYVKYNLLAWLMRADPGWIEVKKEFEVLQAANPHFKVRVRPDLDYWIVGVTWGAKPPMSIDDFGLMLSRNANEALDHLLSHDYSERHFDNPDWCAAVELVRQAAEQYPKFAMQLWDAIYGRDGLGDRQFELLRAIAEGWGKSQLGESGIDAVQRLSTLLGDKGSADAIGRFLIDQIEQQIDKDESPILVSMRKLARNLWCEHREGFTYPEDRLPLSLPPLYLNSWPGFLAHYWCKEVERRWRQSRDEWAGLSDEEAEALIAMLNGNEDALDATEPALARELYFLFAADADFSQKYLLPIFSDPQRHAFGWYPFLHNPRYNDRLLKVGLFESMVKEFRRLDKLSDWELRRAFLELAVSVLSCAGITAEDRERLLDETVLAADGLYVTHFAEAVRLFLLGELVDGTEVWRQWLRKHLERRLEGQPRNASNEELACWADIVPLVGKFVPEAVLLFREHPIGITREFFNWEMLDAVLKDYSAELVGFFADRVRNTHASPSDGVRCSVQNLVKCVRDKIGDVDARPLIMAATESGFSVPPRGHRPK